MNFVHLYVPACEAVRVQAIASRSVIPKLAAWLPRPTGRAPFHSAGDISEVIVIGKAKALCGDVHNTNTRTHTNTPSYQSIIAWRV